MEEMFLGRLHGKYACWRQHTHRGSSVLLPGLSPPYTPTIHQETWGNASSAHPHMSLATAIVCFSCLEILPA